MKIKNYDAGLRRDDLGCLSCANRKSPADEIAATEASVQVPAFNADSYLYVKQQVDFGPRTPGSEARPLRRLSGSQAGSLPGQRCITSVPTSRAKRAHAESPQHHRSSIPTRNAASCSVPWDTVPGPTTTPTKPTTANPSSERTTARSGVGVCSKWPASCNVKLRPSASTSSSSTWSDYGTQQFAETPDRRQRHLVLGLAVLEPCTPCEGLQRTLRHPARHGGRTRSHVPERRCLPAIRRTGGEEGVACSQKAGVGKLLRR